MATVIKGKDVFVWVQRDGTYYLLGCMKTSTIRFETEDIPVATVDSGKFNDFEIGYATGTMTADILNTIDEQSKYQFHEVISNIHNHFAIKIMFTNPSGDVLQYEFMAKLQNIEVSNDVKGFSGSNISWLICGEWTTTLIYDSYSYSASAENWYSDYWETVAGQDYLDGTLDSEQHQYNLTGKMQTEILWVDREGTKYVLITSGTPSGRECKWNTSNNHLEFDPTLPFNAGERVTVAFKG